MFSTAASNRQKNPVRLRHPAIDLNYNKLTFSEDIANIMKSMQHNIINKMSPEM